MLVAMVLWVLLNPVPSTHSAGPPKGFLTGIPSSISRTHRGHIPNTDQSHLLVVGASWCPQNRPVPSWGSPHQPRDPQIPRVEPSGKDVGKHPEQGAQRRIGGRHRGMKSGWQGRVFGE